MTKADKMRAAFATVRDEAWSRHTAASVASCNAAIACAGAMEDCDLERLYDLISSTGRAK